MLCAGCGYARQWHELGTFKCPKETANKNGARGKWRDPLPIDMTDFRGIMRRDWLARQAAYDQASAVTEPEVVPPPLIPARWPAGPHELAGYQGRQAVGMGKRAVAAGWMVQARYWQAHDGTEGCAVSMRTDDLYAVATWKRAAGKAGTTSGWGADIAYGVKRGTMPIKMTHTELERVFDV
jgi:hypothetical protein